MSDNTARQLKDQDFIDDDILAAHLTGPAPTADRVREVIAKSLDKQPLSVAETAILLQTEDPLLQEEIFAAARQLKNQVYGNRIVLFAPLYVGNHCINDCDYCAFKRSNKAVERRTLSQREISEQVRAMEGSGHKRLILVCGEHPRYDASYIADCVRTIYATRNGAAGEIRRVNINAAPLDHEGYRLLSEAGIGTYQIFQETYHHATYARRHPEGTRKGDYLYRLQGLSRAMEAGCDDVGLGVLFGLYDWRFEVLGLVRHALYLQETYHVGPHTISVPRLRPANGVAVEEEHLVDDADFKRLVSILRLAVPYAGLILTAREDPQLRRQLLPFGVSQIDAGSRIELGGYTEAGDAQVMEREQFLLGDIRSLDDVIRELLEDGYLPSFCTACYRLGRTGEHFMEFSIPGFIKEYCTPNGLLTLQEYLVDYASEETRRAGEELLDRELEKIPSRRAAADVRLKLDQIRNENRRDLYY